MDKNDTICEVYKHKQLVSKYMNLIISQLINRSLEHDSSKMVDPELDVFTEFTPKLATTSYGSEEYKSFLKEMEVALKHHYGNNRHHPEHFPNGIKDMDLIDLLEMICDWKAATFKHNDGNILLSIEKNQERFGYSSELSQIFKNTVKLFE
jgi:hypothetical protein